jgi:hypothetical protein
MIRMTLTNFSIKKTCEKFSQVAPFSNCIGFYLSKLLLKQPKHPYSFSFGPSLGVLTKILQRCLDLLSGDLDRDEEELLLFSEGWSPGKIVMIVYTTIHWYSMIHGKNLATKFVKIGFS